MATCQRAVMQTRQRAVMQTRQRAERFLEVAAASRVLRRGAEDLEEVLLRRRCSSALSRSRPVRHRHRRRVGLLLRDKAQWPKAKELAGMFPEPPEPPEPPQSRARHVRGVSTRVEPPPQRASRVASVAMASRAATVLGLTSSCARQVAATTRNKRLRQASGGSLNFAPPGRKSWGQGQEPASFAPPPGGDRKI